MSSRGPFPSLCTLARAAARGAVVSALVMLAPGWSLAEDTSQTETRPLEILAFGDSLVHGYGLAAKDAFPAQLERALIKRGQRVRVINGGNSGETTAGGLARLDWTLADTPDLVLVVLGANDGLRGIDPKETYANLDAILARLKAKGVAVLLAGMLAPRNLGPDYAEAFDAIYPRLAKKHDVAFYPFFLEGVAMERAFTQADGLHPNAAGVAEIVERMTPTVVDVLEKLRAAEDIGNHAEG